MSVQLVIDMKWFCYVIPYVVIRPLKEKIEANALPLSNINTINYSYSAKEAIEQQIESFKQFRLRASIKALPKWSVQSLPKSPLKNFLAEELKKGATLAYLYQKFSQHPHYEWLQSYSVKDFRGRIFENTYYLFSDQSYCKISDVLTRKGHEQMIHQEQRKKALKLFKKGAKASFMFTIRVLGAK